MKTKGMAIFLLLVSGPMWGVGTILIRWSNTETLLVVGGRALIGSFLQFAVLVYLHNKLLAPERARTSFRTGLCHTFARIYLSGSIAQWLAAALAVVEAYALVMAVKSGSVAVAVFIHEGMVLLGVAYLSRKHLDQPTTKQDRVTLAVVISGVFLLGVAGFSITISGTALGLLAGSAAAVKQICYGRRVKQSHTGYGALETSTLANTMVAGAGLAALTYLHDLKVSPFDCGLILILGVALWALPNSLFLVNMRHVTVLRAIMFGLLDPVVSVLGVGILLNEIPPLLAFCGMAAVIAAVVHLWSTHRSEPVRLSTEPVLLEPT